MCALCPISTPGRPGTVTPVTARPGADSAAWYQTGGSVCGRCGSPASIATPATARPLAAQALLSGYRCTRPAGSRVICCNTEPAAIAAPAAEPVAVAGPGAAVVTAGWAVTEAADACAAIGRCRNSGTGLSRRATKAHRAGAAPGTRPW